MKTMPGQEWMGEQNIDAGPVFARIKDLVIKTLLTVEAKINTNLQVLSTER